MVVFESTLQHAILHYMHTYPFEKLEAWQAARNLSVKVYGLTSTFPAEEKYGIVQQLRRAAVSVASNISEGTGRFAPKDQAHFYSMSYGSLMELLNQIIISRDLELLPDHEYDKIRKSIETLSAIISGLRKHTLNKS
jgi:four helix bundle protein